MINKATVSVCVCLWRDKEIGTGSRESEEVGEMFIEREREREKSDSSLLRKISARANMNDSNASNASVVACLVEGTAYGRATGRVPGRGPEVTPSGRGRTCTLFRKTGDGRIWAMSAGGARQLTRTGGLQWRGGTARAAAGAAGAARTGYGAVVLDFAAVPPPRAAAAATAEAEGGPPGQ